MSYVTYDVVPHATYDIVLNIVRTMSYVRYTGYRVIIIDVRHRTCDIVRHVCRTSAYDIVCDTYDIVRFHLRISYTISYVGKGRTMSYVHDIRYRRSISYTTSYVRTMSYVNIRHRMLYIVCDTYDIVRFHLCISYTMSYVGNGRTMSYVHDIRYRRSISDTTSYVRTMSYVNRRYRYIRHRMRYRIRHRIIKNLAVSP